MMRGPAQTWLVLSLMAASGCASPPPPAAPMRADTVTVVAYNIHHAEGMDGRLDLARVARLLNELDADLVALQEVDERVRRTARVDQAGRLAEWTGLQPVFGAFMPYQDGQYGMAVLSRWPIVGSTNHRLPDGAEPRTSLAVRVRSPDSGRELVFAGVHFYRTEEERLAQARTLVQALDTVRAVTILAGDFNSTPDSPVMTELAEDWSIVEKGEDRFTFSSFDPVREIDFVLHRGDGVEVVEQRVLDEPVISDHRPLLVKFVIR